MKRTILVFLSFFTLNVSGQETTNSIRVGYNRSFFSDFDIFGNTIYGDYSRKISANFSIVPSLSISNAYSKNNSVISHHSDFSFGLNLRANPFRNFLNRLDFDFGPFFFFKSNTYGSNIEWLQDDDYKLQNAFSTSEYSYGINGAINFNVYRNNRIEIGIRLAANISLKGVISGESLQSGIYIGLLN